jgi:hypothetical protein
MADLKLPILDLKPAQIALGLLEVEQKIQDYAHLSRDDFHEHSAMHPVPVVKSSHGYYIIDHHHLCRAYHELGHRHVTLDLLADFSAFAPAPFWELMEKASWVLPQDQYGIRHPYRHLPMDVRGMADDPYRSLVWKLKTLGRWIKPQRPFAEFVTANFLRGRVEIANTRDSFDQAVAAATALIDRLTPEELAAAPGLVPAAG